MGFPQKLIVSQEVWEPLQHDAVVSFPSYLSILFHYIEKFNTPALLESGVGTSLINFTAKVQRAQRIQQRLSYQRYFSILTAFFAFSAVLFYLTAEYAEKAKA